MADAVLEVLRRVAREGTIERVGPSSDIDVEVVAELYESGMVRAINASSNDGPGFLDIKMTTEGREYHKRLEQRVYEASPRGRLRRIVAALGVHTATFIASVAASVVAAIVTTLVMRKLGG